ncbi:hypothetical protein EL17_18590 [Anditalea andensis]|uniref:Uncharacterized protein n=1 Tax=Anditalea andensis TaxID=1048983 RepID=A0A074KYP4_9BACT|nr:hypothetical protein EL17_18590 [Anditalea andensis]
MGHRFTVIQIEYMLDDHRSDQYTGIKCRSTGLFGRITFVEKIDQDIPRNLGAEHNSTVIGFKLVAEGSLKSGK